MKVRENLDYTLEALSYVAMNYEQNDIVDSLTRNIEMKELESKIINRFENYLKFLKSLNIEIPEIIQKNQVYFKSILYGSSFIVDFYKNYKELSLQSFKEIVDDFFMEIFIDLLDDKVEKLETNNFIELINKLDITNDAKYNLIYFYVNGEKLFSEIIEGIKPIEEEIKNKIYIIESDLMNSINTLKNKKIIELNEIFDFNFFKDEEYIITLCALFSNQLTMSKIENDNTIYLGYLIYDMLVLKNKSGGEEKRVANILKILSEPTRFKILILLKDRSMYIQEIAKELGLTSATLVHHIELLINNSLVEIVSSEEDKKKIFYRLNTNTIKNIIKSLEKTFI